jgi:5-methylcytosine-specific restriction endonuclease McrA
MKSRTCKDCKEDKSILEFYSGKCYKDGYDIYCKECARTRRRNNDRNPTGTRHKKRTNLDTEFWCPKCKSYKNKSGFYIEKGKRSPSGYSTYCKDCDNLRHNNEKHKERCRDYYNKTVRENPVRVLEERVRRLDVWRRLKDTPRWRVTKSKTDHLRRSRVKETVVTLTKEDIVFLLEIQSNKCSCCNKSFSGTLKYEIDHILPLSKGGNLTLENVQLLCKSCNCSKGNKMIKYRNDINKTEVANG